VRSGDSGADAGGARPDVRPGRRSERAPGSRHTFSDHARLHAGRPCSAPAKNTPLIFFRAGRLVRTRTDSSGHYRVALSPGWWYVRTAEAPQIGSGITPRVARVLAARFRVVNFDIDTGIR
jgi:hypothetical protein